MKTYSPIPKKLLSIALCLAMLMTMLPMPLMAEAAETAATTITPHIQTDERTLYKIGDLDDLKAFRDLVNSGQTNVDAYLTSDINLNGEAWTPIGLAEKPYAGHFDGRGRTISGLSLTGEYTNMAIGLFGYIQGAGIRSLKVSGTNSSTVTSDSNIIASRGLLVGTMVDSILYNCLVSGEMSGSGIVAGSLAGLAQHSIIIDCGSTATLNCADLYMGGLVGYMTAGYDAALCLLNSYCTGNVTHTNTNGYAGGLVGCLFDDAVNNVYTGTVAGNVTSGAMGTLFGYVGNTLQANSNDTTTITFNPVIERNYYLGDALPIGLTSTGMDTTNFASVYTASTLQTTLNDGLDTVNAIIEGHRGYLSTTQWAELVAALDGESVEATQWTVKSGVPSHVIHTLRSDCYCSVCKAYEHTFDADGICIYCKSFQSPDGTGKRSDPYKIGNLGQLYSYAGKALDANYSYGELTADIVVNKNLLKPDGTLNGNPDDFRVWKPIGTQTSPFLCSFNGNGHTISGLYVDGTGTHIGLFGYVKNYQKNIENLGIVDSYFAGDRFVGTISGYNYGGKIYNCYSLNCVVKGDKYVAGITSYAGENVVNCYSNATITGSQYVAGISYQLSMYDMENCLFVGSITAEKNVRALSDSGAYIANSYYLDTCGAEGTGRDGDLPVTAAQLASGEIAYELGSAYGQNIDNGQPRQAYPVLGGAKVLAIMGCDQVNLSGYTNIAGQQSGHSGDYGTNGICPRCGVYETPELVDDYYRITNAGNLYWFADKVNKGGEAERTLNAILVNDIDLEGKPDGSGRSWTPIGTSGGTNSQSFRGTFDGNGKTITGLYVDVQQNALGLFGEVRNGVVKNFTIYGDVKLNSKRDYIGGVIGSACGSDAESGSVISGITSYVNVTLGGNAHGSNRVAGLIGYVNHNTLVENCIWYGTLDLDIYRAQDGVGGLIGNANAQYTGTIRNCAAYGTIRTAYKSGSYVNPSDSTPFTTIYIGGILSNSIPNAASLIENCIWGGTIINETDLGEHAHISAVGTMNGFAGITNCFVLDNTLYITTNGAQDDKITVITQEQLLSGEVAFTLSNTENGSHWGQTLDGVSLPVPEGEKVYYGYLTCTDTQKEYANDSAVDEAKDNHSQEPTYQDNDDGTHTQHYDCCDAEFVMFHSYENNNCVCGAFGGHWGDCQWTLKNNVLTICGIGEIPAPTDWNPYPWGSYSEDITTIIISEGITHISDSAFVGFTALTYVSLPDSLLTMGDGVFSIASSLETIQLPPNMKHIADSTFSTSGLKSITIPEGVESIGDSAFANCTSLTEIILPQTLKHLERNVFGWSTGLKTIEIPASVTTIAAEVFQGTGTKVTVAEDNPYFSSDADGLLYNKDKTVLLHCPVKATEYTIPSTVKEIAASACVDLLVEHLTIPEGVQTIGENAFWLASMKSVNIPTTAESLATNAFLSCNSLEDVYVVCTWNDEAPLYTFNSSNITIHKTLHANYDENNFCVLCGGPRYDSAAMITKNGVNVMAYESLADAFAAVSGATAAEQVTVTLLKNTDLTTPVAAPASGVFVLDLNGFDANIDAKQLTVIDSSATESTAGTGSLITTGTVPLDQTVNGMRYITLENEGVYTFHRLTLYLQKMVLRTSSAGLYFTSYLACDQDLRLAISGFGIAVSTQHMPGKDFATDEAVRYVHYDGLPAIGSQQTHSCLVANIFQEGLSDNAERGKEKIYTNAYIVLDDGTVITAYDNTREVMARSLYDILFVLNEQYPNLDSTTQGTLNTFVSKWEDVITAYGLTNLLPEEQPA